MANYMCEQIADIAANLMAEGETWSFNHLADELGQNPRLMGRRVGSAYKAMRDEGRYEDANNIANAFVDKRGNYCYDRD